MSTFPYRMDAARYVDFLRRVIRAASVLDLRVMNIYLFPFLSAGDDDETAITRFAQAIRPLADEAMACSLTFCLEPEYFDLTRDVSGLRRVLDAVAHPGLRLTFDACNLYQGGEEAFPYAYESLRAHIGHVHLKNGSVFRRTNTAPCAGDRSRTARSTSTPCWHACAATRTTASSCWSRTPATRTNSSTSSVANSISSPRTARADD
jgi:sugar phosphate isomerase/epimerase